MMYVDVLDTYLVAHRNFPFTVLVDGTPLSK